MNYEGKVIENNNEIGEVFDFHFSSIANRQMFASNAITNTVHTLPPSSQTSLILSADNNISYD